MPLVRVVVLPVVPGCPWTAVAEGALMHQEGADVAAVHQAQLTARPVGLEARGTPKGIPSQGTRRGGGSKGIPSQGTTGGTQGAGRPQREGYQQQTQEQIAGQRIHSQSAKSKPWCKGTPPYASIYHDACHSIGGAQRYHLPRKTETNHRCCRGSTDSQHQYTDPPHHETDILQLPRLILMLRVELQAACLSSGTGRTHTLLNNHGQGPHHQQRCNVPLHAEVEPAVCFQSKQQQHWVTGLRGFHFDGLGSRSLIAALVPFPFPSPAPQPLPPPSGPGCTHLPGPSHSPY